MANTDKPFGLRPVGHLCGGEIRTRPYVVTTGQTFYPGDILKTVAGGTVEIGAAADGAIVVGVAAAPVASSAAGATVAVYDDPNIVFEVQVQTGDTPAATDVFSTGDHLATAGDSSTKQSRQEFKLDGNGQLKIIALAPYPDNAWGEHAKIHVIFNEHLYKAAVTGV